MLMRTASITFGSAARNVLARPGMRHVPKQTGQSVGNPVWMRCMSTGDLDKKVANMSREEMKKRMADGSVVVIDVRDYQEVEQTGQIESGGIIARNLPLELVLQAWNFPAEDWEEDFAVEKPRPGQEIVFTCRAGIRSQTAAEHISRTQPHKCYNYQGGSLEWFSNEEKES